MHLSIYVLIEHEGCITFIEVKHDHANTKLMIYAKTKPKQLCQMPKNLNLKVEGFLPFIHLSPLLKNLSKMKDNNASIHDLMWKQHTCHQSTIIHMLLMHLMIISNASTIERRGNETSMTYLNFSRQSLCFKTRKLRPIKLSASKSGSQINSS